MGLVQGYSVDKFGNGAALEWAVVDHQRTFGLCMFDLGFVGALECLIRNPESDNNNVHVSRTKINIKLQKLHMKYVCQLKPENILLTKCLILTISHTIKMLLILCIEAFKILKNQKKTDFKENPKLLCFRLSSHSQILR